jgi:hypothetical protein
MWIVTRGAGLHRVVNGFDDLWEAGRPGHEIIVTPLTDVSTGWHQRGILDRVFQVIAGWPVTALTGQTPMERPVLGLCLVGMALAAQQHAGVANLLCLGGIDSSGAIMP